VLRNSVEPDRPQIQLDACAFIYPNEEHEGIRRIVHGFQDAARAAKRRTVTLTTGTDFHKEAEIIGRLGEFDVKGAVVYPVLPEVEDRLFFAQMLHKCPFPVVLTHVTLPDLVCPAVIVDGVDAGYTMTQRLLSQGLKRIGFLANYAWVSTQRDRYQGYRRALSEAGIVEKADWVVREPSMQPDFEDPIRGFHPWVRRFLESRRDLEGVVCGNDFLALACVDVARELGRRVPEDLKVVGMDDFTMSGQSVPALTTYRIPFEEIGRQAFEMLERLVRGEKLATTEVQIRGNLTVRQSG